ncbi:dermonecrotic toxin domain-containing protein [Pseudomonas veronii]|uniref:dermonecrotic toxin domain-containing protein n=1 Tax=Pseudomonas veronii TaxID=76761 RepID=UPI000FE361C3|nr:DUF6543 domain-containing protein [Pseudomonas veronii]
MITPTAPSPIISQPTSSPDNINPPISFADSGVYSAQWDKYNQAAPRPQPISDEERFETWKLQNAGKSSQWKLDNLPDYAPPSYAKEIRAFHGHPDGTPSSDYRGSFVRNPALENHIMETAPPVMGPSHLVAAHVKFQIKQQFGLDVDPDKTYLTTIAYDHTSHKRPHKGYIVRKISLTDAAMRNIQGEELPSGVPPFRYSTYKQGKPSFDIHEDSRHSKDQPSITGVFNAPDRGRISTHYTGIYTEPSSSSPNSYSAENQVSLSPDDFMKMTWDHAYKKPYDTYIDQYWDANRKEYPTRIKFNFIHAANEQYHNHSLSKEDLLLAERAAGTPHGKSFAQLTPDDLNKPYQPDPGLETKFLSYSGAQSSDIFYVRDKKTQRTLLFMPGNAPQIISSDSPEAMNKWLGAHTAAPNNENSFMSHFLMEDAPSTLFYGGIQKRLRIHQALAKEQGADAYYERLHAWEEGAMFDGKRVADPFTETQKRTESATRTDAYYQFVLNTDHTKNTVIRALGYLSLGTTVLAPLGIAFPPVGYLLTAFSLGAGLGRVGIGIDDTANNRPGGPERILDGAWRSVTPIASSALGNAAAPFGTAIKNVVFKP